jgi:hypothetical protein
MLKTFHTACAMIFLLSSAGAWGRESLVITVPSGECSLSVEADNEWHTLRLRAHHPCYKGCNIAQNDMVSTLAAAFSKTELPALTGEYSSLFLGRLIDYPWLAHTLATAAYHDPAWNAKKGKPITLEINHYVARVLHNPELLAPIENVMARHGYRISGVSVEKVLVGDFRDLPFYEGKTRAGLIPFDAQVWLRLRKN